MLSAGEGVMLPIVVRFSLFASTVTAANAIAVKDAGIKGGGNKDVKQAIAIKARSAVELDTSCANELIVKGTSSLL